MKAVIYLRVSTEEQVNEGYSIDAQKNRAIEYCNKYNYEIVDYYIDEGISGKSLKRPKVQELLNDVKKGKFDIIVVYRLDRFTRNLKDLANVMELLEKYDVKMKSTSEELDVSSLSGRAMVQMLGVFAEFERGSIAERVAMGKEQRAREGYYDAPGRMFGYNYDKENQVYTINEEEAEIVKEMFALHQMGKGVDFISKTFNQRGILTSKGKRFHRDFVIRAFKNGWYYCGKLRYQTKTGEVIYKDALNIPNSILTEEVFLKSYKIYGAKALDTTKKHCDSSYLFKSKLRCAYCNTLMFCNTSAKRYKKDGTSEVYRYYRCGNKRDGRCEESKYWYSSKIEQLFLDYLKYATNRNMEINLTLHQEKTGTLVKNKKLLEEKINKELERKKRLQHLLLDNTFTKEDFFEMLKEITNNIKETREEINQLDSELARLNDIKLLEHEKKIANTLYEDWNKLNVEKKKEFINIFIKAIYVDKEKITRIDFIL